MYTEILSGLKDLLAIVSGADEISKRKKQEYKEALFAISGALNKTSFYFYNKGDDRDLATEAELVELWSKAAILVRNYNIDLALLFENKSAYWINSTIHPPKGDLFSLEAIREEYVNLLSNV